MRLDKERTSWCRFHPLPRPCRRYDKYGPEHRQIRTATLQVPLPRLTDDALPGRVTSLPPHIRPQISRTYPTRGRPPKLETRRCNRLGDMALDSTIRGKQ